MQDNAKYCLIKALENISGKSIPKNILEKCHTTCDMLEAFNNLYKCTVTFSGVLNSTNVSNNMAVTVKDASGNILTPFETNKYLLVAGSYTYNASVEGAVAKENVAFTVSAAELQNGSKSVIVSFTAA